MLGTPAYSIFEGKPAAVDRVLVDRGRLKVLRSASDLPRPVRTDPSAKHRDAAALDYFMELLFTRADRLVGTSA